MALTKQHKQAIRDNPNIRICVMARFLNCNYDLVKLYKKYHKLNKGLQYDGCGIPREGKIT